MAETGFTLKGLDLRRVGYNISRVSGWDGLPGVRSAGAEYAFRHGVTFDQRGFYRERNLAIAMFVLPEDPAGGVSLSAGSHIQANVDDILGACYGLGDLLLSRAMPDGTTRELDVRVTDAIPVDEGPGVFGRAIVLNLRAGYPFWRETGQQSVTGQTTAFNLVNNGNAPINNMVVTFNIAGRLTHDASGDYIEVTTNGLVCDVGARTVKTGGGAFADNQFTRNRSYWIQAEPGSDGFTPSGGADVDVTWYHSWL